MIPTQQLLVYEGMLAISSKKMVTPLVRNKERMDIEEATCNLSPILAHALRSSICFLKNSCCSFHLCGPSTLMPTHLFSGKEPTAHFLNLLGLPVTDTPRVAQVKRGRVALMVRTQHQPVGSIRGGGRASHCPAQRDGAGDTARSRPASRELIPITPTKT